MKSKFKCDKCSVEPEELWSFGPFGNMNDDKEYCPSCFVSMCSKYEQSIPEQILENNQAKNQSLLNVS